MATQFDKKATRTSVSISGPAYKVAVGGAPRGRPRRYNVISTSEKTIVEEYNVLPRYLRPLTGSCHDACKHGGRDEDTEIKSTRTIGSRRRYSMSNSQSTGESQIGSRRRYSMSNSQESQIGSRYLKPKTESCHDSCKHGRDDWVELKTTKTLASRKRAVAKSNGVKRSVVPVERKKITEPIPKPKPKPRVQITRAPTEHVIKLKASVPSLKVTVSTKKMEKDVKPKSDSGKIKNQKPVSKDQHMMTKTKLRQLIAEKIHQMALDEVKSVEEDTIRIPESLETESTNLTNSEISVSSTNEVVKEEDSASEIYESSSIEVVKEEDSTPERCESSSNEVVKEEDSSSEICESSSNEVVKEEDSASEICESSSNEVVKEEDLTSNEVVTEEDSLSESCESSSNNNNNQVVDDDGVQEVVEEIEYSDDEALILEDDNDMEASEGYRVVVCEGEDGEEVKLKLKMGKGREFGSDGPQTIKFKDGRVLEFDGNGGLKKLKFRRGKILDNNCDKEEEKVTLRHQEQEKKKAEELFNSVIEETASKLVEDKKTKVGALVGAFETVISLQDDAPAS